MDEIRRSSFKPNSVKKVSVVTILDGIAGGPPRSANGSCENHAARTFTFTGAYPDRRNKAIKDVDKNKARI